MGPHALLDPAGTCAATPAARAFRTSLDFAVPQGGPGRREQEPVRMGVPLPRGLCSSPAALRLEHATGPAMLQARALDCWPDGSVRWAVLDFQASVEHGRHHGYALTIGTPEEAGAGAAVAIARDGDSLRVETGRAQFTIQPDGGLPFADVRVDGAPVLDARQRGLVIEDARGRTGRLVVRSMAVEESGPVRAVIVCDGAVRFTPRHTRLEFELRLHFTAGSATVRLELTLRNPNRARHRGGVWELGDPGSVYLRDVSLTFAPPATPGGYRVRCSSEQDSPFRDYPPPFELYQESSGGANWRSRAHVNRHGVVPHTCRGYSIRSGDESFAGLRACPIVSLDSARASLAVAVPAFWQNFPKAIESDGASIVVRLFPRQYPDVHELQGGEQKTHTCYVAFAPDAVTEEPLMWCRAPLIPSLGPEAYSEGGAAPYLLPAADDPYREYLALIRPAVEGPHSFEQKRERIDEYGWRHFGDLWADHESTPQRGEAPLVSHYNNQYDAVFGFACHFMRTRDPRWWTLMTELASHVVDIDLYHTDRDRSAYSHGQFWHTFHYVDAGLSTHRGYPGAKGVCGGGPSAEQNYTSGLMLHHFLTGDPRSRSAVIGLGEWVLAMDDGRRTVFRWLDGGDTGLPSATCSPLYHGPGRGAGHSINALLDAHRLTGDARFLEKAEQLIRRCIHPDDDIGGRQLLDAERRWSYTAFLQALGKYLDYKAERGEHDDMYGYARSSLLHYARWMAAKEYPYLDKPEILEFPTETWAAQDVRKSVVLDFAAQHAEPGEWSLFRDRSEFFYRTALATLRRMPTAAFSRPLVLLLSCGFMRGHERLMPSSRPAPASVPEAVPHRSDVFVPQKVRALRRARWLVAAGALGLVIVLAVLRW